MRTLQLNRAETFALFHISHTNLVDAEFGVVRPGDNDILYVKATSPSAPGSELLYEVKRNGQYRVIKSDGYIEGLTKQIVDESED